MKNANPKSDALVIARNRVHRWWLITICRYPADTVFTINDLKGTFDFKVDISQSVPAHGRVVKATARPEYDPTAKPKGGRVTKAMPRQLRKIKEAQEAKLDE